MSTTNQVNVVIGVGFGIVKEKEIVKQPRYSSVTGQIEKYVDTTNYVYNVPGKGLRLVFENRKWEPDPEEIANMAYDELFGVNNPSQKPKHIGVFVDQRCENLIVGKSVQTYNNNEYDLQIVLNHAIPANNNVYCFLRAYV